MENLKCLLERSVKKYGARPAFTLKDDNGNYEDISYIRFYTEAKCVGESLLRAGMGEIRAAIIGKNSYAWFLANAAVQISGGISVPLDKELKYEELLTSLIRSKVTLIFYGRKEKESVFRAFASGKTELTTLVALYDDEDTGLTEGTVPFGKGLSETVFDMRDASKEYVGSNDAMIDKVKIDDDKVSFFLFTSGTTAQSKIVALSQKNVASNVFNMLKAEPFSEKDTNMALLPYHHTFGSTGQWVMLATGCRTVYCDGLKYLQKNFKEYGVSLFIGVPLIVEAMYKKILKTAEKEGLLVRMRKASKFAGILKKTGIDVRRRIFSGVLDALGGKLRLIILGAAAADPEVIKGFYNFGVLAIQGYGLTEASPVIAAEREYYRKAGSVGIAMEGVEINIIDKDENGIGEVIARGDNIMRGYYDDEEATAETIIDGWLHTGDLGYIDKDGYLFLTGRKKNVIVLMNGKNVFPEELEQIITELLPYSVEHIVVGIPNNGNERDLVVCLKLVYDVDVFSGKTKSEIEERVKADIEKINEKIPHYKRIKRIFITNEPMEKTSTGKVKRFKEIDKIIAEDAESRATDKKALVENKE